MEKSLRNIIVLSMKKSKVLIPAKRIESREKTSAVYLLVRDNVFYGKLVLI
jgi:hypothetical protein